MVRPGPSGRLATMGIEIERKFLVADVPADLGVGTPFRQGYLTTDGAVVVRVRITPADAVLTLKAAGSGLARVEVETPLSPDDAEQLWPYTEGQRVIKTRYVVAVEGGDAEVDLYEGALAGLATVEVEFADEHAAHAFTPPPWFGRELTGDHRWTNAWLGREGIPVDGA